ncbi:MAG: serine/threonine-protein kinase [Rubripirellula sp.]|nr:serine/threonine-protein kinase [Rubripirellula sp.]
MPTQTPHPSAKQLSDFSSGQLSSQAAAEVENHISECQPCCETLLGLASDDTFIERLQEAEQLSIDKTADQNLVSDNLCSLPEVPDLLALHPRYEIIGLIGRGGMGDVYQAKHRKMERTVALKVIKRELVRKSEVVDRFHREVKTAAQLSHPNIVTAYDADQAGDYHFMVMEYVNGTDLSETIKDRGPLPVKEACEYIRQSAIGLEHARKQGMVHRDIKPHNLMVTGDGTLKILDFGLAAFAPETVPTIEAAEARSDLTIAGTVMGTPDFISPEQANDARQADIRSDIYSLGATLYYLLAGCPPFADGSVKQKLKSHAETEAESLDSVRGEIPADLAALVAKMMAKDPDDRFQTPAEVAEAFTPYSHGMQPAQEEFHQHQVGPNRKRTYILSLTSIAMFIVAICSAIVYYIQTDQGTVRVAVLDESLAVDISGQTVTMKDGKQNLVIDAGEQKLKVRMTNSDFEIQTDSFEIRRNQEIVFLVERIGDEVIVNKDHKKFNSLLLPPNRRPISSQPSDSGSAQRILDTTENVDLSPGITAILAQSDQSVAGFKQKLHAAISQAAGIPNAQWEQFATDPLGSPNAIVGTPLTYLLLANPRLSAIIHSDAGVQTGELKPSDIDQPLTQVIASSRKLGYVSLIQPKYIKQTTLEIDSGRKRLRGTIQLEAPVPLKGTLDFGLQYKNGLMKVVELTLPEYKLAVALDEKGIWQTLGTSESADTRASATRILQDQGYKILDNGKEIGSRRLVVTQRGQNLNIAEEYSLGLKWEGAPVGIVERDITAEYSLVDDQPVAVLATTSAKEEGSLVIQAAVEFKNGEAVMQWTTYTERGIRLETPRQEKLTVKTPPGPLLLQSAIEILGPRMLTEDGEQKVVCVTFNQRIRSGRPLVEYETDCTIRRTTRPEQAGFTIALFKGDVSKPEVSWEYDVDGNCERVPTGSTTVMIPHPSASASATKK